MRVLHELRACSLHHIRNRPGIPPLGRRRCVQPHRRLGPARSPVLGRLSDRRGRRVWLGVSYHLRTMGFVVVLLSMGVSFLGIPPLGLAPLLIGVLLVGFSWNAVVSITAAYASDRFGISKLGVIYGTMFAVMPLGSGLGAYLGGLLYDFRGTYDWAIWSNILLLLVSALLVFSIREPQRPARLAVSAAD